MKVISLAGITCDRRKKIGTDNVFEKVFENVKYFMKVLKNKYFNRLGYKTALPCLKLIIIQKKLGTDNVFENVKYFMKVL